MPYPGGKNGPGVYQTLINLIPPHEYFATLFGGQCAILQHKRPARRNVLVDRDPEPLKWWAPAAAARSIELYHGCGVQWISHELRLNRWQLAAEIGDQDRDAEPGGPRSRVCWFVYCDPPYPMATRSGGRLYRHELTDDDHRQLLRTLKLLRPPSAAVMISSYPNDLYAQELTGWHSHEFWSTTRAGTRRREIIYMNYPPPAELHDYRYLGHDKREREKIRRRCRNWTNGLARMPAQERAAILQAIRSRSSGAGSGDSGSGGW